MTTFQQGAWSAIHVSSFKKQQATQASREAATCSGCHIKGAQLRFVKMDSSWWGVAACPSCYPHASSHVGLLTLEYPPREKKGEKDKSQYRLF